MKINPNALYYGIVLKDFEYLRSIPDFIVGRYVGLEVNNDIRG
jgi:hypothetical protein